MIWLYTLDSTRGTDLPVNKVCRDGGLGVVEIIPGEAYVQNWMQRGISP